MNKKRFLAAMLCLFALAGCGQRGAATGPGVQNPGRDLNGVELKHMYATSVKYTAEDESAQAYLDIAQRSEALFHLLEERNQAFVMDGYNYQSIDDEGTPVYTQNGMDRPIEIDANGYCIRVSMNYFLVNPIETSSGASIDSQAVYEDNTLNILVPEGLRHYEDEIIEEYRERFYFEKVTVENIYREDVGLPLSLLTMEDLKVHLIYVKDQQEYVTFRRDVAPGTGNLITDPIVVLYTGNIHESYAHSFLTQWVYFYAETYSAQEAYELILPQVRQVGAQESVQKVLALSEEFW